MQRRAAYNSLASAQRRAQAKAFNPLAGAGDRALPEAPDDADVPGQRAAWVEGLRRGVRHAPADRACTGKPSVLLLWRTAA